MRAIRDISSNLPDAEILHELAMLQKFALAVVCIVAGATLLGWMIPAFAALLPQGWDGMKANTAALILFACASIWLSRPRQPPSALVLSRAFGWLIIVIAVLTMAEWAAGRFFHIDSLLVAGAMAQLPQRMIRDVALILLIIGFVLANSRARKSLLARLVDVVTLFMCFVLLPVITGLVMVKLHLLELPPEHSLGTSSVVCLCLLGILVFNRRAEYGWMSVLLGGGIAGKVARIAAPLVLALPFALDTLQSWAIAHIHADPHPISGISASLVSVLSLCFVIAICRKVNNLGNEVRELSLRDELTGLYNRRGFYFLAEQSLRLARRNGEPFTIYYCDLDNLKRINDELGHEVGSALLSEMARIMQKVFQETDVVGRLGGDEFVVACQGHQSLVPGLVERLANAVAHANAAPGRAYQLSYSVGLASVDAGAEDSLDHLLQRADTEMYARKRAKRRRLADNDRSQAE